MEQHDVALADLDTCFASTTSISLTLKAYLLDDVGTCCAASRAAPASPSGGISPTPTSSDRSIGEFDELVAVIVDVLDADWPRPSSCADADPALDDVVVVGGLLVEARNAAWAAARW